MTVSNFPVIIILIYVIMKSTQAFNSQKNEITVAKIYILVFNITKKATQHKEISFAHLTLVDRNLESLQIALFSEKLSL